MRASGPGCECASDQIYGAVSNKASFCCGRSCFGNSRRGLMIYPVYCCTCVVEVFIASISGGLLDPFDTGAAKISAVVSQAKIDSLSLSRTD
jgi:hypothetical protein